MAEGIIDKIMQAFKGMEKDEATLTATEGGMKVDLFKDPGSFITKKEALNSFDAWYDEIQKANAAAGEDSLPPYKALKQVWKESGAPHVSSGNLLTEEETDTFLGGSTDRPFFVDSSANMIPGVGRTGQFKDAIYNIKNLDDFIEELAHAEQFSQSFLPGDKGAIERGMLRLESQIQRDDPTAESIQEGDWGMYDKKMLDLPGENLDWYAVETRAHGSQGSDRLSGISAKLYRRLEELSK